MTQIPLPFGLAARPAMGRSDFFVSESNRLALALVDRWPTWATRTLALVGPGGSGKTHLVNVWQTNSGAGVIAARDLDAAVLAGVAPGAHVALVGLDAALGQGLAPELAFHLHQRTAGAGGSLLVTGRVAPSRWAISLRDLETRLVGATLAAIGAPDDALLAAVLRKHFADRQLKVPENVIPWLVTRLERSLEAVAGMVARLDEAALVAKRPVTITLARAILGN